MMDLVSSTCDGVRTADMATLRSTFADNADGILSEIVRVYLFPRERVALRDEMDSLHRREVLRHPLLRNSLYQKLLSGHLQAWQYETFFSEYNWASQEFFYKTILPKARVAYENEHWRSYIDHIFEEESTPRPHYALFADFMADCGAKMQNALYPASIYAQAQLHGYTAHLPYSCGYALGVEVVAGYDIAVLYRALSQTHAGAVNATQWFEAHLGGQQEEQHALTTVGLVEGVCRSPTDLLAARIGFHAFCDNFFAFTEGVSHVLDTGRPPKYALS